MRKFILSIQDIEGDLEFTYNKDSELLQSCHLRAVLDEKQHTWLLKNFPFTIKNLENLSNVINNNSLLEVKIEITFEMFWDKYFAGRQKDNSSKKRTETKWNKMKKGDQMKAYSYVYKYISSLPPGIVAKYAETYLNAELWNN